MSPKIRKPARICLASLLASASSLAASAVIAQEMGDIALDPIMVYGDRTTSEAAQTTASVGIVEEETLSQPTTDTYRDAFDRVANVNTGDATESGFVLRGLNSEGLTPGGFGAPLASVYIDGVQQTVEGARRGLRSTFDVEQIEVYRGPQSTLTGRNALAGAIYLRTKDPEFARSGEAQVRVGSDERRQVGLAFGDAINDRLAYRVSGIYSEKQSDIDFPSYEQYDRYDDFVTDDYWTARAKLLWLPTGSDDTRVLLSYSHSEDSPTTNFIAGEDFSTAAEGFDERRGDIYGALTPDVYAGFGLPEVPGYQDVPRKTIVDNVGLEITHAFSNALELTSVTGYTRSTTERKSINFGTDGATGTTNGKFEQELFSQELRLNYDESGRLRWVAGLYAARENQTAFREQDIFGPTRTDNETEITNYAAFGEVEYEFLEGISIIAGGRLDDISIDQKAESSGVDTETDFEDRVFLPKLGLRYDVTPNQQVSLVYQEGYRPGGAGIQFSSGDTYEYDPSETQNVELGYRGTFMNGALRVNAALFYQEWNDQQIELQEIPGDFNSNYIDNAGLSESWGGELELTYAATPLVDLNAAFGALTTEFTDFEAGGVDYSGEVFSLAPERTLSLGVDYNIGGTGIFASADATYTGAYKSRIETGTTDRVDLGQYTIVDASVGYGWNNGASITAYASNLFDKEYFTYEAGPNVLAGLGEGREIGVQFGYRF
ncbi:hypothetical protein OCH239_10575 [Roseivivax halodurans JCM 10272]|uniref:TonB-denpendent receptor n=1 Tax=Roseivivax halodurans JCM 10272 TaxID=1449350 RepID=X7EE89_9RHOB|nr:TonB-dependent receptor [Roseivivax halodurans]ETX13418.1 hypothetical protein OCH239_10575 [Roseivivax halodurans JCM 10272]